MFKSVDAPRDAWWLPLLPILKQASEILKQEYQNYCEGGQFNIDQKSDNSPVTQADYRVNHYLFAALTDWRPDLPIVSEESSNIERHHWPLCWMLDPLDGTKEFIQQREEFTINLSLIHTHDTVFAAIVVPCQDVLYIGDVDRLPYKYDLQQQQFWQFDATALSQVLTPSMCLNIGLSHSNQTTAYQQFMQLLSLKHEQIQRIEAGSAYKFCMMLEGQIDIYPRFHPTSEWDTSAGQALLESIGGGLYGLNGKAFRYNLRGSLLNSGFMACVSEASRELAFTVLREIESKA